MLSAPHLPRTRVALPTFACLAGPLAGCGDPADGSSPSIPRWGTGHTVGVEDGVVPDGGRLSPHDTELPAIADLSPSDG
jgi:hypothetical protein